MVIRGWCVRNRQQHAPWVNTEKDEDLGIFTSSFKQIHWVRCGRSGAAAGENRKKWRFPRAVPSFRNTHGVHSDPQDAHPSKFVLLQPPSLFSLPLSLLAFPSVSFLPSLPLSLFLSPPSSLLQGAWMFFLKDSWIFHVRHTYTRAHTRTHVMGQHYVFRYIPDESISILQPLH